MIAASLAGLVSATLVGSMRDTHAAPLGQLSRFRVPKASRPAPGHPARRTTESTVGLLACGSLPSPPSRLSQWQCGTGSPLTVAGAAAELEQSLLTAFPVRISANDRRSGDT